MNKNDTLTLDQGPAIDAAERATAASMATDRLLVIPDNFKLLDLEKYGDARRHFRGSMVTVNPQHFGEYVRKAVEQKGVEDDAPSGAAVFVDPLDLSVEAIIDLGTTSKPGHCAHTAELRLQKTAAFKALEELLSLSSTGRMTQRTLAEFMEDWKPFVECIDEGGGFVETKRAIDAVRRITIESARSVESSAQSLSAERSVMESVAATSKAAPLPATISFSCVPREHLRERTFSMRLSVRTGDEAKPALTLGVHLIRGEEHAEQMGKELAEEIRYRVPLSVPVYAGHFKAL